ncbi:MAG: hypothetical protein AAF847_20810 [Bacteroidota bacterium]
MGYSNYKNLRKVVDTFGIEVKQGILFEAIDPIEPSDWLLKTLEIASIIPLSNEKVKSERVISPILSEVHLHYQERLTLFSGAELNVNSKLDLNGPCDFFFANVPKAYLLEAPIVALTEAKNEDMDYGIAQCCAQMIAAQIFNEQGNTPTPIIWGCSTTAAEWKFLRLENKLLTVDEKSYFTNSLEDLLGVFKLILN